MTPRYGYMRDAVVRLSEPARRGLLPALLAALAPLAAAQSAAQSAATSTDSAPDAAQAPRTDPFCWRGRPLPRCRDFVLFEMGYHARVVSTGTTLQTGTPTGVEEFETESFGTYQLTWAVGAMRNRDSVRAIGGALVIGFADRGYVVSPQLRFRNWFGRTTSAEVGAGPVVVRLPETRPVPGGSFIGYEERPRAGALMDARLNYADRVSGGVRLLAVPDREGMHAGAFASGNVGSGLAVTGTLIAGALVALAIYALASAYD